MCTHACRECDFACKDYSQFCQHLSASHGLKAAEYSKKHGVTTTITTRVRHACKMCGNKVRAAGYENLRTSKWKKNMYGEFSN